MCFGSVLMKIYHYCFRYQISLFPKVVSSIEQAARKGKPIVICNKDDEYRLSKKADNPSIESSASLWYPIVCKVY